jgi:hypothetical protein
VWYGFGEDLNNGYYDPRYYERYGLNGYAYWKITDNNGVNVRVSAGAQRDDSDAEFDFGSDQDVDAKFGLYSDWMLRVHYGHVHNMRGISGLLYIDVFDLQLTRRF